MKETEASTFLNSLIQCSGCIRMKKKKKRGREGEILDRILASEKRRDLKKLKIEGVFLILFHDLASKLHFKGMCPQGSVAQSIKCA